METGVFITLILIVLISVEFAFDFKVKTYELFRIGVLAISIVIFLIIIGFKVFNQENYYPDMVFTLIGTIGILKLVQNYKIHNNFQKK